MKLTSKPRKLQDLPQETLLQIASSLHQDPKCKSNTDLANFSMVHSQVRGPAQEVMLVSPSVRPFQTAGLVRNYIMWPDLAFKVKSLELTSFLKDDPMGYENSASMYFLHSNIGPFRNLWSRPPSLNPGFNMEDDLKAKCRELIANYPHTSVSAKATWDQNLLEGQPAAFLALLLIILPNLKHLMLAANPLRYFPVLQAVVRQGVHIDGHTVHITTAQCGFHRTYLNDVFASVLPQLETLELPCDWPSQPESIQGNIMVSPHIQLPRLADLTKLRHLELDIHSVHDLYFKPVNTRAIFPSSLECLVVHGYQYSHGWIVEIITRKNELFPNLRRIEIHDLTWGSTIYGNRLLQQDQQTEAVARSHNFDLLIVHAEVKSNLFSP